MAPDRGEMKMMEIALALALRLILLEILIDWQTFDKQLSIAIDRLVVALERGSDAD
jgi:hypothetical protein